MPALNVYFPVNAVISIVSTMENGASAEVAVVGREGMVGLASVLGTVESPTNAVVQIAGTAIRVSASQLRTERLRRSSIRTLLDRYAGRGEPAPAAALETMREISGRLLLATIREQEARDEAEAANRAKDQFLATVSHELRTPLNAILGWCVMLAERRGESPERGLEVIQRNAQALLKLVEELLDTARVTADTLSIQPSPLNLTDVIGSAADTLKPAADAKGVVLRAIIPEASIPILGDPARLQQVFLNVLSNALKFTDAGGAIEVCAARVQNMARVTIRDTGDGIAPDFLAHVFE